MFQTILITVISSAASYLVYKKYTANTKKQESAHIKPNTFFLKDGDIDGKNSILYQIASSKNDAFSNPTSFCDLIDKVPEDQVINLVIQTNGGNAVHCERMLRKLKKHKAGYIAYVNSPCYSAGTVIALGANEIIFYKSSMLGKIDPQNSGQKDAQVMIYYSLGKTEQDDKYVTAENIYKVREAEYLYNYEMEMIDILFPVKNELRTNVINNMLISPMPHFKAFGFDDCKKIGLNVRLALDNEIHLFEYKGIITNYQA